MSKQFRKWRLFVSLLWRKDFLDGRISAKTAWEVASILEDTHAKP